ISPVTSVCLEASSVDRASKNGSCGWSIGLGAAFLSSDTDCCTASFLEERGLLFPDLDFGTPIGGSLLLLEASSLLLGGAFSKELSSSNKSSTNCCFSLASKSGS